MPDTHVLSLGVPLDPGLPFDVQVVSWPGVLISKYEAPKGSHHAVEDTHLSRGNDGPPPRPVSAALICADACPLQLMKA